METEPEGARHDFVRIQLGRYTLFGISSNLGGESMKILRNFLALALIAACGPVLAIDRDEAKMELAQAATAVQAAERDDAMRYAPREFDEAHATLALAQQAADARDWNDAALYAERAKVNGDLASARARRQRAEAATAEIQRSVDALRVDDGGAP